jgi:type III restriction enzyme
MYPGDTEEEVSVIGTEAFMEFVESIQAEGVVFERKPMGEGTDAKAPLVIEIDTDNEEEGSGRLGYRSTRFLPPRIYREYKNHLELDVTKFGHQSVIYQQFSEEQQREIVFKKMTTGEVDHTIVLDTAG